MLFGGEEFHFDERAEVGGRLRGVEGDEAFGLVSDYWLTVERRENDVEKRRRANGVVHLTDHQTDFVGVGHQVA